MVDLVLLEEELKDKAQELRPETEPTGLLRLALGHVIRIDVDRGSQEADGVTELATDVGLRLRPYQLEDRGLDEL